MNKKICLFAGTTEGRRLAEILKDAVDLTVCVATGYGEVMLDGIDGINVHKERMDESEMESFFAQNGFGCVIDATHPYASAVTENIRSAADKCNVRVIRILRKADSEIAGAVYVSSVEEARDHLMNKDGNVFITTGSKELASYAGLDMARVWARVLPTASSLEACEKAGVPVSHIIAAQGPFSEETNLAQLHAIGAKFIVTKDSGKNGGFDEKINAAVKAGVTPVIIGRPHQGSGVSIDEAVNELGRIYPLSKRKLYIIGAGPGGETLLTREAVNALDACDAVIGAGPVTKTLNTKKPVYNEFLPGKVRAILDQNASIRKAAIVMRGDAGFYSGAKKMISEFIDADVEVIPGISSVEAFAAKLKTSWDDAALISLHGRGGNIVRTVQSNKKTFALTGGENTVRAICLKLCGYGLNDLRVTVGERLTLPDEKITSGTAESISGQDFDALSIIYIENGDADGSVRTGIPDEEFIRGEVPMTKSEVRAVVLSKLCLRTDSVVWDVGAGTGSVSVECALSAYDGCVYAIEKEHDAADLIRSNKLKFRADNVCVVEGTAPEALSDLPAPTHAFIGGSSGDIREILSVLISKNPDVRIVATTVTLETQSELLECARTFGFETFDVVNIQVSRAKRAGRYHMMSAQNPVSVFVMQGGRSE